VASSLGVTCRKFRDDKSNELTLLPLYHQAARSCRATVIAVPADVNNDSSGYIEPRCVLKFTNAGAVSVSGPPLSPCRHQSAGCFSIDARCALCESKCGIGLISLSLSDGLNQDISSNSQASAIASLALGDVQHDAEQLLEIAMSLMWTLRPISMRHDSNRQMLRVHDTPTLEMATQTIP